MGFVANTNFTVTGVLATAVANAGTFTVAYPSGTSQNTFNTGLANLADCYMVINDNDKWTAAAGNVSFAFGASDITVTNSTGASLPAGSRFTLNLDVKDANDVVVLSLPIQLAAITGNGDVYTDIRPGIAGEIEHVEFVVTTPVTTASRLATLNLEIGTTNVTGGTVALTSANATPLGRVVSNTAQPTANNVLTAASTLSVEASGVTAFAEGAGVLLVRIRRTGNL